MPVTSSDDIKQWLVEQFQRQGVRTQAKDWKRTSKGKDQQGRTRREFAHPQAGTAVVVDVSGGWALDVGVSPSQPTPQFQAPAWCPAAVSAAHAILEKMKEAIANGEDHPAGAVAQEPEYLDAYPALPGLFAFCFPADVYGNEVGTGLTTNSPVEELCIEVWENGSDEYEYELPELIAERLRELGLDAADETHWEFQRDGQMSVAEWTRRLLALGLVYEPNGGNGCLFANELTQLGATHPVKGPLARPPSAAQRQFAAALAQDAAPEVASLLATVPADALADDGLGNSWAAAAFDRGAFGTFALLLAYGAPLSLHEKESQLANPGAWTHRWENVLGGQTMALRWVVMAAGWDPMRTIPLGPLDLHLTEGWEALRHANRSDHQERDTWASLVLKTAEESPDATWLHEAWDTLADRVGAPAADESFVHAWLSVGAHAPLSHPVVAALQERVLALVTAHPALLDTWPSRTAPLAHQALAGLGTAAPTYPLAAALARAAAIVLPSVTGPDGRTVLEKVTADQVECHAEFQKETVRQRGDRLLMVYQHEGGRCETNASRARDRWRQAASLQRALENWASPPAGRKPAP